MRVSFGMGSSCSERSGSWWRAPGRAHTSQPLCRVNLDNSSVCAVRFMSVVRDTSGYLEHVEASRPLRRARRRRPLPVPQRRDVRLLLRAVRDRPNGRADRPTAHAIALHRVRRGRSRPSAAYVASVDSTGPARARPVGALAPPRRAPTRTRRTVRFGGHRRIPCILATRRNAPGTARGEPLHPRGWSMALRFGRGVTTARRGRRHVRRRSRIRRVPPAPPNRAVPGRS